MERYKHYQSVMSLTYYRTVVYTQYYQMVIGEAMQIKSVIDMGQVIRMTRQQKGWSQSQLADQLGTSQRWVSEIENGKSRAEMGRVLKCLRVLEINLTSAINDEIAEQKHAKTLRDTIAHGLIGSGGFRVPGQALDQTDEEDPS